MRQFLRDKVPPEKRRKLIEGRHDWRSEMDADMIFCFCCTDPTAKKRI